MDNEDYINFLESSEKSIRNISSSDKPFPESNVENILFHNSPTIHKFTLSLCKGIENLDEELSRFEKKFTSSHNSIFWASDYNDVFTFLKKIIDIHNAHSVRLPNINTSTIFRELGIKYFLQDENIELADNADIQFFAVDMMFSDNGTLLLLNQSNNTLARITNSSTNVFFVTIDRLCTNSDWAETIQQVASYGNGGAHQDMVLFKTSSNCNNYLFIVDNQRSNLLGVPYLRQSLSCLQCGRCSNVCPVFRTIGQLPYNNVFSGPVANITLPFLESFDSYKHVTFACTLCGRCEQVCPLQLPLREMIIKVRNMFFQDNVVDKNYRRIMMVMRKYAFNRKKLNGVHFLRRHLFFKYTSSQFRKGRVIPQLAIQPFNKAYKKMSDNV